MNAIVRNLVNTLEQTLWHLMNFPHSALAPSLALSGVGPSSSTSKSGWGDLSFDGMLWGVPTRTVNQSSGTGGPASEATNVPSAEQDKRGLMHKAAHGIIQKMRTMDKNFPYQREPRMSEVVLGNPDPPTKNELHDPGPPTFERSDAVQTASSLQPVPISELDMSAAAPVYAPKTPLSHRYDTVPGPGGSEVASFRLYRIAIDYANQTPMTQYDTLHIDEKRVYMAHMSAVQKRQLTYTDPSTGHSVFTVAQLIANGRCCGNACRHCPYHLINVPEETRKKKLWNGAFWV